jgi:hypothetical protein
MVFCDLGVNPTPWGYSVYEDVITKLAAAGIPPEQVAVVGDAATDAKKQVLFERVRNGSVRVLLGSTAKMGTGTNVQRRLVALHHLDAPWKPAEVEQRDGRILRQGNTNTEVAVFRYVTEGSFDAFMWQALETKARFIAQVVTGKNVSRRAEDVGGQELSYAEVKAIASGNPAVLTLAEADAELQRLNILRRNHLDEQFAARRAVRDLPRAIQAKAESLSELLADQATAGAHLEDRLTIDGHPCSRRDEAAALTDKLDSLPLHVGQSTRVVLGTFRGLAFGLVLRPGLSSDVFLAGKTTRHSMLSRDHPGPRAVLNGLDRLAHEYGPESARVRQDIAVAEAQLRDHQARLGQPFAHEAYLAELTGLRDQLRDGLAGKSPPQDGAERPTVAALAERIAAVRSAHVVAASPERAERRATAAEEPVVARIRRRTGRAAVAGPTPGTPSAGSPFTWQPSSDGPGRSR